VSTPAQPHRPRITGRAAILVLVLAVLVVSYASSMRAYLEQKNHLEALRTNITESEQNIEELRREKGRWDDPAYVEAQARQRFGWVMPGEIGYQVIGRDGEPLSSDDSLTDPDVATEANLPLWWESAWGTVETAGDPQRADAPTDQIGELRKRKKSSR